jgi:hypothetical protein
MLLVATIGPALAGSPAPQAEEERVRALVEAGALPRAALGEAQKAEEKARWEKVLQDTLFQKDMKASQIPAMLEAAEKLRQLARDSLVRSVTLAGAGALPAAKLATAKEQAELADKQYALAQSRAESLRSLAEIARAESRLRELEAEDLAFHSDGSGDWILPEEDLFSLDAAFYQEFGHVLPFSAQGGTALHRSLGFDHSDRFDVALHPDSPEGNFLLQLLDSWGIPYIAFRSSVPGQSTGPHVHIGPRSGRIPPSLEPEP